MESVIYYNELYDLYSGLLTDKQRKYYEDYYFNDLSLGEMSDLYGVSRNAIYKQVNNVLTKLDGYEETLGLLNMRKELLEVIDTIKDKKIKDKLDKIVDEI